MPTAYSYVRFSSAQQATSDSMRRQIELSQRWLVDHPSVQLDTSLRMTDAGRSGFSRDNWATYALAKFVESIRLGWVESGSYLLVENLDRLSREETGKAIELFLSIVNRGVTIVQLSPETIEFRTPVDMVMMIRAVLEMSRGHSESAMKSSRGEANWTEKQKQAAEKKIVTRKVPGWISAVGGAGKALKNTTVGEVRFGAGGEPLSRSAYPEGNVPRGLTGWHDTRRADARTGSNRG